jgi:hypothetical protein
MKVVDEAVIPAKPSAEPESGSKGRARGWIPAVALLAGMTIAEAPQFAPENP